ncbi:hypothetical protein [Microbacterium sp. P04]|uniref:hypothetical protein n=1 Tax=Microbacterium sp. P04 TaxID=3366947 RepID=UPI00374672BB
MNDREVRPGVDPAPALWVVQLLVAAGASFSVWLQGMNVAGCGSRNCDFAVLRLSGDVFYVYALVLLAVSGVLLLALPTRRSDRVRLSADSWVPIAGIALTVIGCAASLLAFYSALS